jgi:dolichol-phosphate mannosyltransferase
MMEMNKITGSNGFVEASSASGRPMLLSIVIPMYNEEESIPALLERLGSFCAALDEEVEVIFVDDHSSDATPALLNLACQNNPVYRFLRLSRNSGSHVAIIAGMAYTRGDCAVFLAADLQDPPELIPEMIKQWREGNHVVWAVREKREGVSFSEQFFANTFYWLMNRFSQVQLPPTGADFALIDRVVIDALPASAGTNPSLINTIIWNGFRQTWIPYVKEARKFGRSKWNLGMKLKAFADAFVSFSFVPMRMMLYTGTITATLGFIYAIIVVAVRLFTNGPIEGWASLMVVILIIGGIQMLMFGVLGEYLWRTLEESRKRPLYLIEAGSPAPDLSAKQVARDNETVATTRLDYRVGKTTQGEG